MKKVTLKFNSLHSLSECMYQLGIIKSYIDYSNYTLTAVLSEKQITQAKECLAEIVVDVYTGMML